MTSEIVWHYHHLVPKHANGCDNKNNLLKCNIAMHAFLHEQRYKDFGDEYDRIAFRGLKGMISKSELISATIAESNKRNKTGFKHSEKTKQAQSKKMKDRGVPSHKPWLLSPSILNQPQRINKVKQLTQDGKSVNEIVAITGIPQSTVYRLRKLV